MSPPSQAPVAVPPFNVFPLLQGMVHGLLVLDATSGTPVFANAAAVRLAGVASPGALLASPWETLLDAFLSAEPPGQPFAAEQHPVRRVLRGECVSPVDLHFRSGTCGVPRRIRLEALPLPDDAGRVQHVALLLREMMEGSEEKWQALERERELARRAQEEAAERRLSEQRLQIALESGRMGYFEYDLEKQKTTLSPYVEALYGMAPGTYDGRVETFARILHPEDRASMLGRVAGMVRGEHDVDLIRFRIVRADGTLRWVTTYNRLLRDDAGRPTRILGINQDATEQMRAEEQARALEREQARRAEAEATERLIVSIIDSIQEPVFSLDSEWNYRFVNRAAEALLGCKREEVIGRSARQASLDPRQLPLREWMLEAMQTGQTTMRSSELSDGRSVEMWTAPNAGGLTITWRDVTARKREQEASARRARYGALRGDISLTLASPEPLSILLQRCTEVLTSHLGVEVAGLWMHTAAETPMLELQACAGRFTVENGPFSRWPRPKSGQGAAHGVQTLFTNELQTLPPVVREWAQAQGFTAAAVVPLGLGEQLVGVVSLFSARPFPEDLLPALSAMADILAQGIVRKRAEEALARRAEELARSNSELEQFAYVASHDLQEPLRMVGSYVQLLARRYKDKLDADAQEFIGFAVDGVQRARRLIGELLTYSRVGTQAKPLAPVSCEGVMKRVLANLQQAIADRNAEVTVTALPEVMGDEVQLEQLLQNLVGNALKFHGDKPVQVRVSAERKGEEWLFAVADNGIGIEPAYFEKIFVIFQRLHGREQYEGTGLGLAICKKIVEHHQGRIWVESKPGEGSTFYFTLPAHPELAA